MIEVNSAHNSTNRFKVSQKLISSITSQSSVLSATTSKVTLSNEGKQLASSNSLIDGVQGYALPSWMPQYHSPLNDLSASIKAIQNGKAYQELSTTLQSDGYLSSKEKQGLQLYLQNSEGIQNFKRQAEDRDIFHNELSEYGQSVNIALKSAMYAIGVSSSEEYNEKVRIDPLSSDLAHQVFRNELLANPRSEYLMNVLRIRA